MEIKKLKDLLNKVNDGEDCSELINSLCDEDLDFVFMNMTLKGRNNIVNYLSKDILDKINKHK